MTEVTPIPENTRFSSIFEYNRFMTPLLYTGYLLFGGRGWIRTIVVCDNGFTVRSLWPLGNPSSFIWYFAIIHQFIEMSTYIILGVIHLNSLQQNTFTFLKKLVDFDV